MQVGPLSPVSNRADFKILREVTDSDTDELIDLTGGVIKVEISYSRQHRDYGFHGRCLSASTEDATVTIVSLGVFQAWFTADQMRGLCSGTYDIGCTIEINDETYQFFIGTLPVLDGIVR